MRGTTKAGRAKYLELIALVGDDLGDVEVAGVKDDLVDSLRIEDDKVVEDATTDGLGGPVDGPVEMEVRRPDALIIRERRQVAVVGGGHGGVWA